MTERGLPGVDGAPACPFVAFEDDRETRAGSPDHRHRCYAELVPSPRAAAHQEAYCLSSAFPVCPTFQDWARREAAHARGEGERPRTAPMAQPESEEAAAAAAAALDLPVRGAYDEPRPTHQFPSPEPPVHRNPHRDWAAPPPWASGGTGTSAAGGARRPGGAEAAGTPEFLAGRADESRGLAGSAADRLAGRPSSGDDRGPARPEVPSVAAAPDPELAGLVTGRRAGPPAHDYLPPARNTNLPRVSSTRSQRDRDRDRERERDAIVGPSWERARRYEAYPTIRTRAGFPTLPRLAVLTAALAIAAVALFFLPALLGIGGGGSGDESATPSPSTSQGVASPSAEPATPAAPTAQVYIVEAGDTMSKIAPRFGFTADELCDANKETIPDCDKLGIGDEITIPVKAPDEFVDPSAATSPEPS
jgi:hypothetical protein